jgi:nitrite reductase/ring-hydroxylating ferredoxin subunit
MGKFTKVLDKKALPAGRATAIELAGKKIAIFNVNDKYYAIDDECTHAGGSLSEGEIDGVVVTCPWHGATFDVATGEVLSAPAFERVNSYKVQVVGEEIQIEEP